MSSQAKNKAEKHSKSASLAQVHIGLREGKFVREKGKKSTIMLPKKTNKDKS